MEFSVLFEKMGVLFLLLAIGFAANKLHVLDSVANQRLSQLVFNISLPALIITSVASGYGQIDNRALPAIFLGFAAAQLIPMLLALFFPPLVRAKREDAGIYRYIIAFGNVGFMGFPVVLALFGQEMLFYCSIFNIVFNLLTFSVGVKWIAGSPNAKFNIKNLLNMPMLASFLGVAMFLLKIQIPSAAGDVLGSLANTTTPASMLILGSTLAEMDGKALFRGWRVYLSALLRLIAVPAAVWLGMGFFFPTGSPIFQIAVVLSAMPSAVSGTMLAIEYGGNNTLVTQGIFFTTVLSLITAPVMIYILL